VKRILPGTSKTCKNLSKGLVSVNIRYSSKTWSLDVAISSKKILLNQSSFQQSVIVHGVDVRPLDRQGAPALNGT
jgi:hypothetical protein